MKQNYFVYNKKQYYSGTVIVVNRYDWKTNCRAIQECIFIYHNTDNNKVLYKVRNQCETDYCSWEEFNNRLVKITNEIDFEGIKTEYGWHFPKRTLKKELNIDGMFIAWIWYIFIMLILTIFKGRILAWIGVTIIFMNYREKKLREAGFKK